MNFYKTSKEEVEKKMMELKNEFDQEETESLEAKLLETSAEIQALQEEIKQNHDSEMDSVEVITLEIKEATKTLQEISEEEISLRNLVDSLKTELEQVKKEQQELKEKEQASEALAANLTGELKSSKEESI
ncbi:WEB family protein [Trifolium repens]|nr:WEB family protein [Trifolium repens]